MSDEMDEKLRGCCCCIMLKISSNVGPGNTVVFVALVLVVVGESDVKVFV